MKNWTEYIHHSESMWLNVSMMFDHRFVIRNYDDEGLYSYELDFIKKRVDKFLQVQEDTTDIQQKTEITVLIETERAPKFENCIPILDHIQERYPNKKIICSHHDWQEVETDYVKIPSLSFLSSAIDGCGTQITEDPKDYDDKDYKISNDKDRSKLFISTHKTRRIHKDKQIRFLRENNLEEKGLVSIAWERKYLEDNLNGQLLAEIEVENKQKNPMKAFYHQVFTDISCESLHGHDSYSGIGHFQSEKLFKPFIYGVIPMITTWKDSDKPLRVYGLDLFDDVIDTSFWNEENLEKKFQIIKENIFTIESNCIENNRFKNSIWTRILENQSKILNTDNMEKFVNHYKGEKK